MRLSTLPLSFLFKESHNNILGSTDVKAIGCCCCIPSFRTNFGYIQIYRIIYFNQTSFWNRSFFLVSKLFLKFCHFCCCITSKVLKTFRIGGVTTLFLVTRYTYNKKKNCPHNGAIFFAAAVLSDGSSKPFYSTSIEYNLLMDSKWTLQDTQVWKVFFLYLRSCQKPIQQWENPSIQKRTQVFHKFVRLYIFRVAKSEMKLHFKRNMEPGKIFHVKSPENPL